MENCGFQLKVWQQALEKTNDRKNFACEMVVQVSEALRQLHSFGFSHCDLKMGNICASVTSQNNLKFTLIDFGLCSRLDRQQKYHESQGFRGNLVYTSSHHLIMGQANEIDDLTSLVYVAYKFIFGSLPWEKNEHSLATNFSISNKAKYIAYRHKNKKLFEQQLIATDSPFKSLFPYLEKEIHKCKLAERESFVMKEEQTAPRKIDYQKIKNLVQSYDVLDCS